MRFLPIILVFIWFSSCTAQTDKTLIENWKSYPVPSNPDSIYKLGFSLNDWTIFMGNNKVNVISSTKFEYKSELPFKIKLSKNDPIELRGKQSVIQVDDGYLVGFYRGEWGGNLYWFSKDGEKHYKISDDEIVQFVQRNNKVYAIEGLAHLNSSKGSILNIEKTDGKWSVNTYLILPSAPDAIGFDVQNNFIIATSKSLLKIDNEAKINTLIEKGIWYYGLYPTSLVIDNNKVFIGMRKGVFKYDLQSGNQEWLLPD